MHIHGYQKSHTQCYVRFRTSKLEDGGLRIICIKNLILPHNCFSH